MGYRSRQAMELGAFILLLSLLVNVSNSKLFLVETNSKEEIKNEVQDYGGADYGGERCNTNNCKVDGGWSAWGSCSKTCGVGTSKRSCTNPTPSYSPKGAYCYGSSSQSCNNQFCKNY